MSPIANDEGDPPRLAELIAALSLATDLGLGQPMEHVMRSCLLAVRLGERLGLTDDQRAEVYYVTLLAWVGCLADSTETSAWFGDDIAFRAEAAHVDDASLPMLWFLLRRAGSGAPPLTRVLRAGSVLASGGRVVARSMAANCQVTSQLAERLGLGPGVKRSLVQVFARWDGTGMPTGLRGEAIAPSVRLMQWPTWS